MEPFKRTVPAITAKKKTKRNRNEEAYLLLRDIFDDSPDGIKKAKKAANQLMKIIKEVVDEAKAKVKAKQDLT